jgi:inosine/xanthosine triphosphate pyrophosphatase family protein
MKEIIIGTTNPAKLEQLRGAIEPLGLTVCEISADIVLPKVVEDGKTALENAEKKALVYAKLIGKNVLSMDNALYFDGVQTEEQPGLNVRRIKGFDNIGTDSELLAYYSALIEKLGDRIGGHWEYGVCLATPTGEKYGTTIISPRIFISKASSTVVAGYPLESIQIDPKTKKYISEMSKEEQNLFWQKNIGKELVSFIKSINIIN